MQKGGQKCDADVVKNVIRNVIRNVTQNVSQNVSQKCDAKKSLAFLATEPVFLANEVRPFCWTV